MPYSVVREGNTYPANSTGSVVYKYFIVNIPASGIGTVYADFGKDANGANNTAALLNGA